MKLLVLANAPVSAGAVQDAVGSADSGDTEVLVVAPAVHDSPLRFWMSDADEAIGRAQETARQTVEGLRDADVESEGETGEADPLVAVQDALATFEADRILVVQHDPDDQAYREDDDLPAQLEQRFGLPVSSVRAGA